MTAALRLLSCCLLTLAASSSFAQSVLWNLTPRMMVQKYSLPGCNAFQGSGISAPRMMAVAANGDLVVTGCASSGGSGSHMLTVRYSGTTGAPLWSATYSGAQRRTDVAAAMTIDPAGDVIVTGWTFDTSIERVRTTKYDGATGATIWSTVSGTPGTRSYAYAVATSSTGDVFLTGREGTDFFTAKLSGATGTESWAARFNGSFGGDDRAQAIAVDAAGDAYVTGYSGEQVTGSQLRTIKYNGATGAQLWTHQLGGNDEDTGGVALTFDPAGNLLLGGNTYSNVTGGDYRVIKYAPGDGQVLWNVTFTGLVPGGDLLNAIAADAAGDVFVTGSTYDGDSDWDLRTLKLSGATGAELWNMREASPAGDDWAYALALDGSGDVVVTSRIETGTLTHKMRTLKYRGSDGLKLWTSDHGAGVDQTYAAGLGVGIDGAGNVLVAGQSSEPGVEFHFRVLKLAGSSGAPLWIAGAVPVPAHVLYSVISKPRNGRFATLTTTPDLTSELVLRDSASGQAVWSAVVDSLWQPVAPVIDAVGNVFVAGQLDGRLGALKFAAADGTRLWTYRFGPDLSVFQPGAALAIALDATGNPVVAGRNCEFVLSPDGCYDKWRLLKLDTMSGLPLWVAPYPNPTLPFNERVTAIAIDSQGDVIASGIGVEPAVIVRTAKYSGATGAPGWAQPVPIDPVQKAHSIEIDAQDNAFVLVGTTDFAGPEVRLVKYATSGGQLWNVAVAPAGSMGEIPTGLALFPDGDPVVTLGNPFATAPYGRVLRVWSSNGATLWARSHAADGSGDIGAPMAVAVDGSGNVRVTGHSLAAGTKTPRVLSHHGGSGAVLWNLPVASNRDAAAVGLVLDGAGTAYMAAMVVDPGLPPAMMIAAVTGGPAVPRIAGSDFNGNGSSDLLWAHADGRAAIWLMNGTAPAATQEIIGAGSSWNAQLVADFDGDGNSDLAWQHSDGRVAIYLMNGATPSATAQILNGGGSWSITHAPDLNGDGKADLVFQNADGTVAAWTMNGTAMIAGTTIIAPGTGWSVIRTADFDGDGKDDLLWRHTDGRHAIWLMDGTAIASTAQILNAGLWTATHTPDLNGDGKADIVWQHPSGSVAAWLMNGSAMASGASLLDGLTGWSVTRAGDFNGDGKADLFFLHADGRGAIYLMNGLTPTQTTQILNAGGGWSAKRLLDLNGDGKSDIVWQNADGRHAIWLMNGTTMVDGSEILGPGTGWSVSSYNQ